MVAEADRVMWQSTIPGAPDRTLRSLSSIFGHRTPKSIIVIRTRAIDSDYDQGLLCQGITTPLSAAFIAMDSAAELKKDVWMT